MNERITIFAFLKPFLKKHQKSLIAVLFSIFFTSFAVLAIGKVLQLMIDRGVSGSNYELLNQAVSYFGIFSVVLAIATYFRSYTVNMICEKIMADIRSNIFSRIVYWPMERFESFKVSDIMTRLTNDMTLVGSLAVTSISGVIRNFILLLGGVILMIESSPILSLYVFLMLGLILWPLLWYSKRVRAMTKQYIEQNSIIASEIQEDLTGISLIKLFAIENFMENRFKNILEAGLIIADKRFNKRSIFFAMAIALVFSTINLVLWIGARKVISGQMMSGELSSFLFYAAIVALSIATLVELMGELSKASGAAAMVVDLLNYELETKDNDDKEIEILSGDLNIENISFSYSTNILHKIFNKFSLNIKHGEKLAIVGHSGAGKSSLIALLLRLYNITEGRILFGNANAAEVPLRSWRKLFVTVPQDVFIFSASISDNLKLAKLDATDKEIDNALRAAEIYDFVQQLPDGINSFVGERGLRLSGGQRQRIGIARAFLSQSPIVLLDEPTSNLDVENEHNIKNSLDSLMKEKTTIIISHRLSTIMDADRIVVLDKGEIRSIGTHNELINICPIYQRLHELSFQVDID